MAGKKATLIVIGWKNGAEHHVEIPGARSVCVTDPNGRWLNLEWDERLQAFRIRTSGPMTIEPEVTNAATICVKR